MKNNKDIELRSEEVQEVMGQVPAWIVRWGITLLFLVVVALLVGSCFFKYPDVITADMTLTGQHPATAVVTRAARQHGGCYIPREGVGTIRDGRG